MKRKIMSFGESAAIGFTPTKRCASGNEAYLRVKAN